MSDPLNDGLSMFIDPVINGLMFIINFIMTHLFWIIGIAAIGFFGYYIWKEFINEKEGEEE